jgi:hypothetical protein
MVIEQALAPISLFGPTLHPALKNQAGTTTYYLAIQSSPAGFSKDFVGSLPLLDLPTTAQELRKNVSRGERGGSRPDQAKSLFLRRIFILPLTIKLQRG